MNKFIILLILIVSSLVIFVFDSITNLGEFYFYFISLYILLKYLDEKNIEFDIIWAFAFLFMILGEVFINKELIYIENSLEAFRFLCLANNIVLIGYLFTSTIQKKSVKLKEYPEKRYYSSSKYGGWVLFFLVISFVIVQLDFAVAAYTISRLYAQKYFSTGLLGNFFNSLGFILPAWIAYYFSILKKKNFLFSFLFSLPIFIIFFMGGTRYYILFSLLGFFLVFQSNNSLKFSFRGFLFALLMVFSLGFISLYLKSKRFLEIDSLSSNSTLNNFESFPSFISNSIFSNEGAIKEFSLLISHFSHSDYLYGKSISFISYFWIPRDLWPDKPKMLGRWMVDKYYPDLPETHSITFGFVGDLYADFGYFSLLFYFGFGFLIKKLNKFKNLQFQLGNENVILGSMLFPVLFFFVRDPITSILNLVSILILFFVIKSFILKKCNR